MLREEKESREEYMTSYSSWMFKYLQQMLIENITHRGDISLGLYNDKRSKLNA